MDILFLSQVLPYPLDAGPKVRSYYVLRHLARRHRVTLVCFSRPADTPAAFAHLRTFCAEVHPVPLERTRFRDALALGQSLVTNRSLLVIRDEITAMREMILGLTRAHRFEAIHADQLSMASYALQVSGTPRIWDAHNAFWLLVRRLSDTTSSPGRRLLLRREAGLLKRYEAALCAVFDRVTTVTREDRAALTFADQPSRAPLVTIPICIDPGETSPVPFQPGAADIVCVGGMFYPPNVEGVVWFAREAMPLIWAERPGTRFFIVGARPAAELRALAAREPRVIVTGYVPDVSAILREAAAFVVPLRAGGGMRVKILDAWARGLPLVTTTIGCEGIDILPGVNLLIGDNPRQLAQACLALLSDRASARHIAENGRAWVAARYDWRTVYRAFDEIYDGFAATPTGELDKPRATPPPAEARNG